MEYFAKVWPYFGVLLGFGLGFYSARRRATEKRAADLELYKAGFLNPLEVEHEQEISLQKLEGRIDAIQMQHPDWTFSQVIRSEAGRETMFQWLLAHQWTAFRLESLRQAKAGAKGLTVSNYTELVEKTVAPEAMSVILNRFIDQMEPWLEKRLS